MRRSLAALVFALLLPLPVLAGQVTVKPGETLSEIAERHGVSLSRLMQLNGISRADHVEVGQVLRLPGNGGSGGSGTRAGGTVRVQEGDTLSEIAARQGMSLSQLMALNGISRADHVEVGQLLRVSGRPAAPAATYRRGASVHVVRAGESLSAIADGYGVPMDRLVAINQLDDPDHVEVGRRLKLQGSAPRPRPAVSPAPAPRATPAASRTTSPEAAVTRAAQDAAAAPTPIADRLSSPTTSPTAARGDGAPAAPATSQGTVALATSPSRATSTRPPQRSRASTATPAPTPAETTSAGDWRRYGPLQVDWSGWQPMGGSLVAPVMNAKGDTLYLAINCGARKLNATSVAGDWRTWDTPQADFEQRLVTDLCRNRGA